MSDKSQRVPPRSSVVAMAIQSLFDFSRPTSIHEWYVVNDDVMGGISRSEISRTERKSLQFTGDLSLERNGGFASVRTLPKNLHLQSGDILIAQLIGDGREYSFNLYPNRPQTAFSYRCRIATLANQRLTHRFTFDQFLATSFGRPVPGAGSLEPSEIAAVGFLLSDKSPGSFCLEIDWIRVQRRSAEAFSFFAEMWTFEHH
ncbi:CIA30 family protein [Telmatocola sphagniphila]|uniref:CIA30 family protein n=1 Tax=Telmatocola sphagniphila TaxID=1123043 RepID=A0A8E6B785_9BACT|nr:CIA30 family protein [Telmatocola sphagniphila]QVL33177.1 CIA30 family protein [Telmatocola sphagniphila]